MIPASTMIARLRHLTVLHVLQTLLNRFAPLLQDTTMMDHRRKNLTPGKRDGVLPGNCLWNASELILPSKLIDTTLTSLDFLYAPQLMVQEFGRKMAVVCENSADQFLLLRSELTSMSSLPPVLKSIHAELRLVRFHTNILGKTHRSLRGCTLLLHRHVCHVNVAKEFTHVLVSPRFICHHVITSAYTS